MDLEHDVTKLCHDGSHYVTITCCVTSYRMISLYDGQCEIMGVISCFDRNSSFRGQKATVLGAVLASGDLQEPIRTVHCCLFLNQNARLFSISDFKTCCFII